MYIRPRRSTSRRRGFSIRRLFIWLFVPVLIVGAAGVYTMREEVRILVAPLFDSVAKQAADTVATIGAPTPIQRRTHPAPASAEAHGQRAFQEPAPVRRICRAAHDVTGITITRSADHAGAPDDAVQAAKTRDR